MKPIHQKKKRLKLSCFLVLQVCSFPKVTLTKISRFTANIFQPCDISYNMKLSGKTGVSKTPDYIYEIHLNGSHIFFISFGHLVVGFPTS